jgi:hypothetical protein
MNSIFSPHDTFTHAGKLYNLVKARHLIRHDKSFLLPIDSLLWILQYDSPESEERISKAKHRYPLIVSKWNGRWVVVDGLHRLVKYQRKGIRVIPVKELTADMLRKCLIPR